MAATATKAAVAATAATAVMAATAAAAAAAAVAAMAAIATMTAAVLAAKGVMCETMQNAASRKQVGSCVKSAVRGQLGTMCYRV